MTFDIDNVLPILDIDDNDIIVDDETIELVKEVEIERDVEEVIEEEEEEESEDSKPSTVSTLLYKELVEKGIATAVADKEEFSWDDIDSAFKNYTEDLPLKVARSLIDSIPEEGKNLMNFLLAKQESLTKEDLQTFYNEHLSSISESIDDEDTAREFLKNHYNGKFRASQITAMLDTLEDEEALVEEAKKVKSELNKQTEEKLERDRESRITNQKQFVESLSTEFNTLGWSSDKVAKIKQSISSGDGNAKLAKIAQSPNGLIHLYNFMNYFDDNSGKFDLKDFANIVKSKEARRLKDDLTEDMLTSASNSTKASTKSKNDKYDLSKMQPII